VVFIKKKMKRKSIGWYSDRISQHCGRSLRKGAAYRLRIKD